MRIRNLARSHAEVTARHVLSRLEKHGYRINVNPRVSDALECDWRELDDGERWAFRTMHFDFVVTREEFLSPVFVVEFDGPRHQHNATSQRLDAVKNSFCQQADLPMLRITSRELEPNEKVSLLEWMLARHVAWQKELPGIRREIEEFVSDVGPDYPAVRDTVESGIADPSLDPTFIFDLRHPYPAILTIAHRLHRLGIITGRESIRLIAPLTATRNPEHLLECIPSGGGEGPVGADSRYFDYQAEVRPWEGSIHPSHGPVLYTSQQRVVWRWALPVGWEAPGIVAAVREGVTLEEPREWDLWLNAMRHLWSSDLPGAWSHDTAEGLAEYLVLRDVEQWALQHRVTRAG